MKRNTRIWLAASSVVAALLVTLVVPVLVAPAQAATVTPAVSPPAQWAYGGQRWVNVSEQLGHGTYAASAFFGWQVVVTATNTSTTTVQLETQRSLGISYEAKYCAPDCTHPSAEGQVSILGYESDVGFANLTSVGTVFENGTAASAVGLLNASGASQAKLNESLLLTLSGGNGTESASGFLNVAGTSTSAVTFDAGGLGLVPWNAMPGTSWNSTATFAASGSWSLDYAMQAAGFHGMMHNQAANLSGNVNATGSLAVFGADLGNITLNNGMTVPRIALVVIGPFDIVDGVVLVPHDFDLFTATARPWSASAPGVPTASTGEVDFLVDHVHHAFRLTAAMTSYATQSASITAATPSQAVGTAAVSATGVDATPVQAQPESVSAAQSASTCYANGCEATAAVPGGTGGLFSGLLGVALIGLLVAAVVGTVAALEWRAWSRRRAADTVPPRTVTADYAQTLPASATPPLPPPPPPGEAGLPSAPKGPS